MENNIYLDTNIFIDLLDSTRPFSTGSFTVLRIFTSEGRNLYINSDTVTNAFYILSKTKKYTSMELIQIMKKTVSIFTVVAVENDEVLEALSLCEDDATTFKDYEDALQYICAKKIGASLILTNDKGFVPIDIKVQKTNEPVS
jgi:predicted nucleic acid-binding protein